MADELTTLPDAALTLKAFETVIKNRENGTSELSDSWHFLQLYSYWGIFLPNTENALKLKLHIKDPLSFSFFPSMLDAYSKLHDASNDFINNIFNKVVALGNDLKSFAEQAATRNPELEKDTTKSIFTVAIECLDDSDLESALALITDMQESAAANATASGEVIKLLAGYKAKLSDGVGKLTNVGVAIESDNRTSKATIERLSGDKDTLGSIANSVKLLQESNERYKQDVIKATTTLTYGWVFPYGTIAAVIVAGIFGDRAVKELRNLDEMTAKLKTKSLELETAVTTVQTQNMAQSGVTQALALTDSAITHTTILQNAWNGLDGELRKVLELLNKSTATVDDKVVLKNKVVVKTYLTNAGNAWANVLLPINQLTANPYITVNRNEVTLTQMADDVQKEIDRLKAIEAKNAEDLKKALEDADKNKG
jgi:hypothetical protein